MLLDEADELLGTVHQPLLDLPVEPLGQQIPHMMIVFHEPLEILLRVPPVIRLCAFRTDGSVSLFPSPDGVSGKTRAAGYHIDGICAVFTHVHILADCIYFVK